MKMPSGGANERGRLQSFTEKDAVRGDEASLRREARYLIRELANLLPFYGLSVEGSHYTRARETLAALSASYCDEALRGERLADLLVELRGLRHTLVTGLERAPKGRLRRHYA